MGNRLHVGLFDDEDLNSPSWALQEEASELPKFNLNHLKNLSDDTGIVQHATYSVPNRNEGYCVDDNARALLLTAYLESLKPLNADISMLQGRYLSYVYNAFNPENRRFRNFMSYARGWLDEEGTDDSQGRSLWALGTTINRCRDLGRVDLARSLFLHSIPSIYETTSLRTWAYALIAADEYLKAYPNSKPVQSFRETMLKRVLDCWRYGNCPGWPWFEGYLTYGNARICQGVIVTGQAMEDQQTIDAGLQSLEWLMELQTGPGGVFAPIGTNGFYERSGERNYFDQQPIEAWSSVSACLSAYALTQDSKWLNEAQRSFRWFLGDNMVGIPVYDQATGGCHDGLHEDRVNRNQGAESTLAFLCSLSELKLAAG